MGAETRPDFTVIFVQYVLPVLGTFVASMATLALGALARWLQEKASTSKLAAMGARVTHFAEVIVADLNATVRPEMERLASDGELSELDKAKLKSLAMHRLQVMLTEHGLDELKKTLGIFAPTIDGYLSGLIERAVTGSKASTGGTTVIVGKAAQLPPMPQSA